MEEASDKKRQGCLTGLKGGNMASATTARNQGDAYRLPASVLQLNPDEHGAQSAATQRMELTESQDDIPSSTIRQMLTISVMLLAGSGRPRGLLSRLLGSDKLPAQKGDKGYIDRARDEMSMGSRGPSPPRKGKAKAVQNSPEYGDSLCEMHLCACILCLKERELKWQLFLLREQEAMISNSLVQENCVQPQLVSPELQGRQYCSSFPRIGSNLDNDFCQRQYCTSTPPTALGFPNSQAESRAQSHLRKGPQNPSIHRFMAFITFQFMILLHYLYPWAKALAEDVIATGRRHRLWERLGNQTCILLHWIWRVLIIGAFGWILENPDTEGSGYRHNQPSRGILEKERARSGRDETTVVVRRWIKKGIAEIIDGVCEGVEGGVKVWCGAAEQ
ncbi:hypothetical protein EV426DRAFT_609318 [Tirmania nivea]|nr:hypothetical protein EV426DRAFT_609318 [Tirmania nivea]